MEPSGTVAGRSDSEDLTAKPEDWQLEMMACRMLGVSGTCMISNGVPCTSTGPRAQYELPEQLPSSAMQLGEAEDISPLQLLQEFDGVNVAAPLVRYSKSPFRKLVASYNVSLTHTPMIVAREFTRSAVGRDADFSLLPDERGVHQLLERGSVRNCRPVKGCLVAQFGANDAEELAAAAELVAPYVSGIDLNCGCPVKNHATGRDAIGAALLREPELVHDMIRMTKRRMSTTVSLKIRLDPDLRKTDALIRTAVQAGASYISIHGRTRHQASTEPVDLEGLAFAASVAHTCGIPAVANGDVWSLKEAQYARKKCGVQAVMSARGLLANPALFSGLERTPSEAVERFFGYAIQAGLPFALGHRQLAYMLEARFTKHERLHFNSLPSYASTMDTLADLGIVTWS